MTKTAVVQPAQATSFSPPAQGILWRKCACGTHTMGGGQCADCEKKKSGLQRKLTVGTSNDPLEQEADRVAEQVMRMPDSISTASTGSAGISIQRRVHGSSIARMPILQRAEANGGESKEEGGSCPSWRGDPQSISKRAGEFYARNNLTPPSQAKVMKIDCEPPRDNGNYGCYVHFDDGLVLRVIIRETDIVVGTGPGPITTEHPPPNTPLCFYEYSCPDGGDLVLTVKKCQSSKPSGSSGPPAVAQRAVASGSGARTAMTAPPTVHDVLSSSGQPLDAATRAFFEPRFGYDFSQVRVHTGAAAEQSARDVNAHAYTMGHNIVFGAGQFAPGMRAGQRLIAHELTHVVQQSGDDAHASTLRRADRDAVNRTLSLGNVVGSGLRFFPSNVVDTVVGPVSVRGGLLSSRASRLNVIAAENLTPRLLARQLLPLWTTATPFTLPGAAAPVPLDIIDEETLAKGLLVYNQHYLPVPAMRRWQAGLRFPLPVEIDEGTGVATLHPTLIRNLAGGFDAAWMPLLDARVRATVAPVPATLTRDVTAFLANEPTAQGRGIHLGARSQTNATAELSFIRETFSQLGTNGFEVALNFMDYLVNREISLLAAQADGAAILGIIQAALAAAPGAVTPEQQRRLDRANLMLGLVVGTVAQAAPAAMTTQPEKTVTVDTLKLQGSTHNPSTDVLIANAIYSQCNVRVVHGVNADDNQSALPQTTTWLGGDTDLRSANNCAGPSAEERALFSTASAAHAMASGGSRYSAFYVATVTGTSGSGYSCRTGLSPHPLFRNKVVIGNTASTDTLAHELGHHLINSGAHPAGTIMGARPRPTEITGPQCANIYARA